MAKELNIGIGISGLTVTATPYLAGVAQTPIALAELGTTGLYQGDMAGVAGTYQIAFIAGGITYGSGEIMWGGSAEVVAPTAAQNAAAVGARVVEGSITADGIARIQLASIANAGTVPAGAGSFAFNSLDNTKTRIAGTVAANGARAITALDPT